MDESSTVTYSDGDYEYHAEVARFLRLGMGDNGTWLIQWHQIKQELRFVYPFIIFMFCSIGLIGVIGNCVLLFTIMSRRLYQNPTVLLIGNLAMSDVLKALVVMPMSVSVLLLQNWVFGSFMCFFLPMVQSLQLHVSMLSFVLITVDRYRCVIHPTKQRVPAVVSIIAVWAISVTLVIPLALYPTYIDIGHVIPSIEGIGICYFPVEKPYKEYVRGIFVALYAMPLAIIAFLCVKISAELKTRITSCGGDGGGGDGHAEEDILRSEASYHSRATYATWDGRIEPDGESVTSSQVNHFDHRYELSDCDDDIDPYKEKRTQKYMMTMVILFALAWCPLQIMYLLLPFIAPEESTVESHHIDIAYIACTWIGFLSTCYNPILFALWQMSNKAKELLRGYFRFSNKRRRSTTDPRRAGPDDGRPAAVRQSFSSSIQTNLNSPARHSLTSSAHEHSDVNNQPILDKGLSGTP